MQPGGSPDVGVALLGCSLQHPTGFIEGIARFHIMIHTYHPTFQHLYRLFPLLFAVALF